MTREEIALLLDLDDPFTSGDVQAAYSQRLDRARQNLASAGSKPARLMAQKELSRIEPLESEIAQFVESAQAFEEASKYMDKAKACLRDGKPRLAVVSYRRIQKVRQDLLPEDIQDEIEELGIQIEDANESTHGKAEDEASEAEVELAHSEPSATPEACAPVVAGPVGPSPAELARLEAESLAKKEAEEAEAIRLAQERNRQIQQLAAQEAREQQEREEREKAELAAKAAAEQATREEAERLAKEQAEHAALEQAAQERAAAERISRQADEAIARLDQTEAVLKAGDDTQARTLLNDVMRVAGGVELRDDILTRISSIRAILDHRAMETSIIAELNASLAKVETAVAKGDYEQAADILIHCAETPHSDDARIIWEGRCKKQAQDACGRFASTRLGEARVALKAGYKSSVQPLLNVAMRVLKVLPTPQPLMEECAKLGASVNVAVVAKTSVCNRITIEYHRGDMQKRRLHILTLATATFGRSTSADVIVRVLASRGDAERVNRLIGRKHFTIENSGTYVSVVDGSRLDNGTVEASKNGVYIDTRKVVYPRSVEGKGEMLHIASAQMASDVAHWSMKLIFSESVARSMSPAVSAVQPDGKWPSIAGFFMARQDEMPEDVLFVWGAVPLSVVDESLSKFWIVRAGDGMMLWDGVSLRDVTGASETLHVMSFGRLSHIGG